MAGQPSSARTADDDGNRSNEAADASSFHFHSASASSPAQDLPHKQQGAIVAIELLAEADEMVWAKKMQPHRTR